MIRVISIVLRLLPGMLISTLGFVFIRTSVLLGSVSAWRGIGFLFAGLVWITIEFLRLTDDIHDIFLYYFEDEKKGKVLGGIGGASLAINGILFIVANSAISGFACILAGILLFAWSIAVTGGNNKIEKYLVAFICITFVLFGIGVISERSIAFLAGITIPLVIDTWLVGVLGLKHTGAIFSGAMFMSVAAIPIFIGAIIAFGVSIKIFTISLFCNRNPYIKYVDKKAVTNTGVRRNYFFGPGFYQIYTVVATSFIELVDIALDYKDEATNAWRDDNNFYETMPYLIAFLGIFVFGIIWMSLFSIILSTVIFVGMCLFFILFGFLWTADRISLALKSIHCRCSNCKRISLVPNFICDKCWTEHRKLTPGPYGIFRRKCSCGKHLSTTYFNGRSEYQAACPFCGSFLAVSDAQQFGIQLVGGASTGKTTFLAAFWHEYLRRVKTIQGVSVTAYPKATFSELEYWFQSGISSATTETNANMYSMIHKYGANTPIQMTIYDIAGEAFTSLSDIIQQQQFKYCEGIVFVIDPNAKPTDVSETISSFLNEFSRLKGKSSTKTSDVPVAVMISKADLYKREIGLPKIKATHNSNAQKYADADGIVSMEQTRCGVCREFLENHGFSNTLNLINCEFSKVQYYAVSAMGHPPIQGKKYEPWGVLEPITWLLQQSSVLFQEIFYQYNER